MRFFYLQDNGVMREISNQERIDAMKEQGITIYEYGGKEPDWNLIPNDKGKLVKRPLYSGSPVEKVKRYDKGKIIDIIIANGLLEQFNAILESDPALKARWLGHSVIMGNDPMLAAVTEQITAQYPDLDVDALMRKCEV